MSGNERIFKNENGFILCVHIKEFEHFLTMMIMCMLGNGKMLMIYHVKKPLLEMLTVEAHLGVGAFMCGWVCSYVYVLNTYTYHRYIYIHIMGIYTHLRCI